MNIILGVGAGIAAYKVASLLRLLTEDGHDVRVIPTSASLEFVGAATWEALSHHKVTSSVFDDVDEVAHVRLGHEADLVIVAPATADLLAKARLGLASDLLGATMLMAADKLVMIPAMHTEMWEHPATQDNVAVLRERGVAVMDPAVGRLTGTDTGAGRLPEPGDIYAFIRELPAFQLSQMHDGDASSSAESSPSHPLALSGKSVLVTAGGTREPLDPVRFLGNRSSGKQGVALAAAARDLGAQVTLVAAHLDVPAPTGVEVIQVESALGMREVTLEQAASSDVVIMAAAVADYRPQEVAATKMKKRGDEADPVITLVRNPDILAELGATRPGGEGQYIVGFAAETGDDRGSALEYGQAKLEAKGADLMVLNEVDHGKVFGEDANAVLLLSKDAEPEAVSGSKTDVARAVLARVAEAVSGRER
ncbi:bifunctional phosphopantothenoylcysteine decarboxylase/phosphopantothenate--cysteine ligase CoaBC [Haematomicrobium sanguinis]|uniref:bifunctional phosphopantothenoylcysteine decarboxylase/phosphopantothenate--cysteine ligase CoaBC n=1 Tax=Haematomicrobium sanguinis TaxID=479106 RepID=UPI00047E3DDA|nr:bifunctional phosphopantothenoylcysteine decarboxylase/phosphopantothenate--cysteine ligase CoaBC [Haematomicrobium sanguinis]